MRVRVSPQGPCSFQVPRGIWWAWGCAHSGQSGPAALGIPSSMHGGSHSFQEIPTLCQAHTSLASPEALQGWHCSLSFTGEEAKA